MARGKAAPGNLFHSNLAVHPQICKADLLLIVRAVRPLRLARLRSWAMTLLIMTDRLIIALAQLNPTVGAISANLAKARAEVAKLSGVDLVLFPELYIAGYPPEDLVLRLSLIHI